ncbi:AsmA family protein [Vibrio campbellii]|uniref:AsmA family protein n=1 Tax=Vibrio campbellii TaxID=680 RepID=A0AAQ2XWJ1_9VIBR|nr:AsmA family protein [Vibrio campbellii]EDL68728.1 AsmA family [Vibrio campbellii HY01]WDG08220.1 AsmA family protein [Vibrio campbellii]
MKTASRVLLLILILAIAVPAVFVGMLTTSHSRQTWNLFSDLVDLPLQADNVQYEFPYHLTLNGVATKQQNLPFIEQVDLWLNPDVRRDGKWIVDSLLIDGLSLQQGMPTLPALGNVYFHQIALKNIDYADDAFSITGLDVQIQDPIWSSDTQQVPYGEIQLSAEQLHWNGEAFDKLLIDVDYKPQDSTLYGASFNWRGSEVSGQGEQYPQGWSIINMTVDKLKIDNIQLQSLLAKPWQALPVHISHINSLDLLNADIEYGDWHWQNLELSLENASLPLSLWGTTAQLSLQADSVSFQDQTAIEPRLNATLKSGSIQLKELSLDWQQGRVQVSGEFEPEHWKINNATISGLKWAIQPDDKVDWWQKATERLQQVNVKQLEIERSQVIQLSKQPYWQLSGLNLEGDQLEVKHNNGHWGIWSGKLDASVVNASYDQVITSHAAIATQSDDGLWQLTRLFAPLEQGYIEGLGQIDLSTTSQPWTLSLNADGIPLQLLHPYLPTALTVNGFSDLSLDLKGLAGDQNMLAYSLSGEVEANLRDTTLKSQADDSLKAITFSPLRLRAQRGEVKLQPVTISGKAISGNLSGEFDMANNPLSGVIYQLKDTCGVIKGDVLSGEIETNECQHKPKQKEQTEPEQSTPEPSKVTHIAAINLEQHEEELSEEVMEEEEPTATSHSEEQLISAPEVSANDSINEEASPEEHNTPDANHSATEQGASVNQDAPQETPAPAPLTAK